MSKFNDSSEISQTIGEAYPGLKKEVIQPPTQGEDEATTPSPIGGLPSLPGDVFDGLPPMLDKLVRQLQPGYERDTVLLAAIAAASGLLPGVTGEYGQTRQNVNIFVLVGAPAGSGKGLAGRAVNLFSGFADEQARRGDQAFRAWKKQQADNPDDTPPPKRLNLYLAANTSGAGLYGPVAENSGAGIISGSELDTLTDANKRDYGQFSEFLRHVGQNETYRVSRKSDGQICIDSPACSLFLTGTLNQIFRLFTSAEDGLFSRVLFYIFEGNGEIIDPRPNPDKPGFGRVLAEVKPYADQWAAEWFARQAEIRLCPAGWNHIATGLHHFRGRLNDLFGDEGEHQSIWKRAGLQSWRIAAVLAALKHDPGPVLGVSPDDVRRAVLIVRYLIEHNALIFRNLKDSAPVNLKQSDKWLDVLTALPDTFTTGQAAEAAKKAGLSEKTVRRRLKDGAGVSQVKHGEYVKR